MKSKLHLLFALFLSFWSLLPAPSTVAIAAPTQSLVPSWTKSYGGDNDEYGYATIPGVDGGALVVATTKSFGAGMRDSWLLKLDDAGAVEWQRTFGGNGDDGTMAAAHTPDGGYLVAGFTGTYGFGTSDANHDGWLLKLDADGDILWQKTYGGPGDDAAYSIAPAPGGGYIVAGFTRSFGAGAIDVWVFKIDEIGNVLWQKAFGGGDDDGGLAVRSTSDGGFVVASYTYTFGRGGWVLKLDGTGNSVWQLAFNNQTPRTVITTSDGQILVAGILFVAPGDNDIWVQKLSLAGDILWERTYATPVGTEWAESAFATADGGYLVSGLSSGFGVGDLWLLNLDDTGQVNWHVAYGGSGGEAGTSVFQIGDRIWLAGLTTSYGAGGLDVWMLSFNAANRNDATCLQSAGSTVLGEPLAGPSQVTFAGGASANFAPGLSHAVAYTTMVEAVSACPFLNTPPTANAGGPYSVSEGGSVGLSASATDPDSASLTYAWDLDQNGTFETAGQSTAVSTVGLDGPGSAVVTVQVCDDGANCDTSSVDITILNVPPQIDSLSAPSVPVPINTAFAVEAAFSDPGTLDTHTALWDWGDGSTSAGLVSESLGSGSVTGSHAYAAAGVYTLQLAVTDKDGGSDVAEYTYIVTYDPDGGFVTGGGWIQSPPGAYAPDPALVGTAKFGFVSKYQKGAVVPTGQTQFHFQVASLNFHSAAYDWLVVAGARAQYKGTGTINGTGDYRFMLTAIDGQVNGGGGVDRFRLKIWDKLTGAIVYDNQIGASDTDDPTTALGGGSIVIHK